MGIVEQMLLGVLYICLYIIVTVFISGMFVVFISQDEDDFFFFAWVFGAILYVATITVT